MTTTTTSTRPRSFMRRPLAPWAAPLVAAFVGVVVWLVGTASGVDIATQTAAGVRPVGLASVIVVALVVGYAGWGVRALLRRTRSGGERAWLVTCGVVLVVSLVGALSGATPSAVGMLVALHVGVGAAIALGLRRC